MAIETESVECNLCGSTRSRVIATGADREYHTSKDEFSFARCADCNLVYLNPRPVAAELPRIYPATYHSYILDRASGSRGSFITRMRQRAAARRFRPVMKHLRGLETIDLLDVGCGNGWMLQLFKSLDPDRVRTFGVEISEPVCDTARKLGHTVYCGRFEDVNLDRTFEVVNLTHVIEHVSDPRLVVRKAFNALKPGGLLVLETPNVGAVEWPLFKDGAWGAYHIPRHWYLFDRATIRQLGEAEGFAMIDWYCHPGPTHWVWTMHNICEGRTDVFGRLGRWIFDPVRIFRGGMISTLAMGVFYIVDRALLALPRQTSVMTAIFRRA
jgi:2-polyprenyl-3-methyl-5-hydroxy-6-metoxy-1,4-benzoquinol methylase